MVSRLRSKKCRVMIGGVIALGVVVAAGATAGLWSDSGEAARTEAAAVLGSTDTTPVALTDIAPGDTYKGRGGGLYGAGRNEPPAAHGAAAESALANVRPLDARGQPSPDGQIAMISIGMSNTSQEFVPFIELAAEKGIVPEEIVILNGAQGGRPADRWAEGDEPWERLELRMRREGVSAQQVQLIWMKQALGGPKGTFGQAAGELEGHLESIVQEAQVRFPNLQIIYLSSRTYAGYALTRLNPEPYAYESAFSVRSLIQRQIAGDSALNFDPQLGDVRAPVLLWGPYLWANGEDPRDDGLTWLQEDFRADDGTHPSELGQQKVAGILVDFFQPIFAQISAD